MSQNCQQPLDITVSEGEHIFFKSTGTHTIYLTGNFCISADEGRQPFGEDDDDEDDYDLSPDEDEIDLDGMDGEESDDLDDLENPRVTEVESEGEEAPKLVEAKGKNKRAADSDDEAGLDDLMVKDAKAKPNGEPALSKKQQKKLKKNDGEAAAVEQKQKQESKDGKDGKAKSDKKVQFAKNLEQGPTPSPQEKKPNGTLGVKQVKGVTIDDKKLGSGPGAKNGNKISMRYIGKLESGKVFDCKLLHSTIDCAITNLCLANKSGSPFSFKLGKGEVIDGWEIGVAGMAVGGERRITVPANLAYGKKALPGIPANSTLVFDVKLVNLK